MQAKSININISLRIAGQTKSAVLTGYAFIESGFLSGRIESIDNQMSKQEKVLLTAFTFTGCPIAARVENSELNPWLLTGGTYSSIRTLSGVGFEIVAKLNSVGGGDAINMDLNIECAGILPSISSIKYPFQENIRQIQQGKLEGRFNVIFNTNNHEELIAHATSSYELDINQNSVPVWRNITILNAGENDNFVQVEQIDLFGNKEIADKDLNEKSKVAVFKN